ncbi:mevalonate kinase [Teredinibacter turnerae]|uniref:mevalonate kinase family protein n=1 Tax=Teredinibacter turnerae TaxID=2426 RepID=UPI00036A5D6C|nr:hypothetical protein [Teredinibacter turnerae]
MTKTLHASAPGKVILCGEYAVLQGAPALVAGIDRRVNLQLKSQASSRSGITLCCPGFLPGGSQLHWQATELVSTEPSLTLLIKLFNALLAEIPRATDILRSHSWALEIDSRALFDTQHKLGLGSSGALATALAGVLWTLSGAVPSREQAWPIIHKAHSIAQGKQGSGADVAASLCGGTCVFSNQQQLHCTLEPLRLPQGTHLAFIWTGTSASTPKYLHSLSQWRERHPTSFAQQMGLLEEQSRTSAMARTANELVANFRQFTEVLHEFDRDSQLGIFANGHEQLYLSGRKYRHLTYKPCGAGGGDLGLAVASDTIELTDFLAQLGKHGVHALPLAIDYSGLTTEQHE